MTATKRASPTDLTRAWGLTLIIALVLGFVFLRPYLAVIALAGVLAIIFDPLYQRILKRTHGRKSLAVTLTTVLSLLIFGIPIFIIFVVTAAQAIAMVDKLNIDSLHLGAGGLTDTINSTVAKANEIINNVAGVENALKSDGIINTVKSALPQIAQFFVHLVSSLVSSIPRFITSFILYLFVFTGFLANREKVLETLHNLSPFDEDINNVYFKRIGAMTKAMLRGQLLIAFLQGLTSSLSLLVLGLGDYFFFFLVLFTFMSLVPLGAGIITIPLGLIAIAFGNVWQGIFILLVHFLINTNIDNFRPKLVPKEARLPAALTILSAFAGVAYFGLLGVIYGPIIMIAITTTIEMYIQQKKRFQKTKS